MLVDIVYEFGFESGGRYIFDCLVDVRFEMGSCMIEGTLRINEKSFGSVEKYLGSFNTTTISIGARMLRVFR
jgi:hypothetical protein